MKFSYKKFLFAFIIVMVLSAVCIPLTGATESVSGDNTSSVIVTPPVIEPEPDTDIPDVAIPTFRNVYDAWEYAYYFLDVDENGHRGYEITSNIKVDATAEVPGVGLGISSVQNIYTKAIGYKKENYEFMIAACEVSVAENASTTFYRNDNDVWKKSTTKLDKSNASNITDIKYDYLGCPLEHYSHEDFLREVTYTGFNQINYQIKKSTVKAVNYFKRDTNNNYKFKVTLMTEAIPEIYVTNMEHKAGGKNLVFKEFVLEGVISSKTGKLLWLNKYEDYSMTARGFNLLCQSSSMFIINSCGKEVQVPKPFEGEI